MKRIETSGMVVLFIGVIMLMFSFFNAYVFLSGRLEVMGGQDIVEAFSGSLAPLVSACIRVLYLAVMGWLASILTIRGTQLLKIEKQTPPETEKKTTPKKKGRAKTAS